MPPKAFFTSKTHTVLLHGFVIGIESLKPLQKQFHYFLSIFPNIFLLLVVGSQIIFFRFYSKLRPHSYSLNRILKEYGGFFYKIIPSLQ